MAVEALLPLPRLKRSGMIEIGGERLLSSNRKLLVTVVACAFLTGASSALAATAECEAAQAALRDVFQAQPGTHALDTMGNRRRVKLMLGLFGDTLTKSWPGDDDKDGGGWYTQMADGSPTGAEPPHAETLAMLKQFPTLDAAQSCPTLNAVAAGMGWVKPSAQAVRPGRNGHYQYTSVSMMLPVVSASHGEAVAWVEQQSGPLAGGSYLVLLRTNPDGRWQVVAQFPVSIS